MTKPNDMIFTPAQALTLAALLAQFEYESADPRTLWAKEMKQLAPYLKKMAAAVEAHQK